MLSPTLSAAIPMAVKAEILFNPFPNWYVLQGLAGHLADMYRSMTKASYQNLGGSMTKHGDFDTRDDAPEGAAAGALCPCFMLMINKDLSSLSVLRKR